MVVGGKPVGASIVGVQAGELIGLWAMAIANGLKMSAIANTVLPYPTLAEINKRAAGAYFSPKLFDSALVKRVVGLVQRVPALNPAFEAPEHDVQITLRSLPDPDDGLRDAGRGADLRAVGRALPRGLPAACGWNGRRSRRWPFWPTT